MTDINQYVMGHKRGWEEAQRRIAKLERLVAMAHEMDVDCYDDVYAVKWLANRMMKEQSE